MKGQGKPNRIKNMKQYFNRMLMGMIKSGNTAYNKLVQGAEQKLGIRQRFVGSSFHPTRNGNKRPGRTRKNHAGNWPRPNPVRRARKTLNGEIQHLVYPRGAMNGYVPTMDQTKALEDRLGLKVQVRGGKCFVGTTQLEMPINVTIDKATTLLDAHLHTKYGGDLGGDYADIHGNHLNLNSR